MTAARLKTPMTLGTAEILWTLATVEILSTPRTLRTPVSTRELE